MNIQVKRLILSRKENNQTMMRMNLIPGWALRIRQSADLVDPMGPFGVASKIFES